MEAVAGKSSLLPRGLFLGGVGIPRFMQVALARHSVGRDGAAP